METAEPILTTLYQQVKFKWDENVQFSEEETLKDFPVPVFIGLKYPFQPMLNLLEFSRLHTFVEKTFKTYQINVNYTKVIQLENLGTDVLKNAHLVV